ncbi:hypothetical protein GGC03_12770 [Vibrio sp. THAF191c]|nr:hypothetical protein GGC03_12770 [Vibrio sp. THAF191c]
MRVPLEVTIRAVQIEDADGVRGVLNPIIEQGKFTVIDTPVFTCRRAGFYTPVS